MPPMIAAASEDSMTAQIIPLSRPENGKTPAALHRPPEPTYRASLTGALRRSWHRVRLLVEAFGWIVLTASIIAAVRG